MSQQYLTYDDIKSRNPIETFSRRHHIQISSVETILLLCDNLSISETKRFLQDISNKKITYDQLKHLYNEIKLRNLLLQLLKDGAKLSEEGLLERAELLELVTFQKGKRVIIGTYRNVVQRNSYKRMTRC